MRDKDDILTEPHSCAAFRARAYAATFLGLLFTWGAVSLYTRTPMSSKREEIIRTFTAHGQWEYKSPPKWLPPMLRSFYYKGSRNNPVGYRLDRPSLTLNYRQLGQFPSLRRLSLYQADITEAELGFLEHLTQLEKLVLASTKTTDRTLLWLQGMPLRELYLNRTDITDDGLALLRALPLEVLCLDFTHVTDEGLVHLTQLPIRDLGLGGTQVTDSGLYHLKELPLQQLRLSHTDVTGRGLQEIAGLSLEELDLGFTKVDDSGLVYLATMPLRELDLTFTKITDAGLRQLAKCPLETLILDVPHISDTGLRHLEALRTLERLEIWGTSVTQEGITRLREALPTITIQNRGVQ